MQHRTFYLAIVVILAVASLAGLASYYSASVHLSQAQAQLALQKNDERVVNFLSMFVNKVIKADKEIGYDDRLELENAVRQLGDKEILEQWKKFTDSKTESEAQSNTKELLAKLVNKISKK
ncbi:MAG: hypothetical protein COU31_03885 [Candidatus Magasanikbacteria bacterium CG10_big_fil_rev_8_21_14_0_10_40_10]|uniref:Uncharacterized protein n=1 Tax=Candidatus Magasanikbacteria bacterium CG10_big_fil_rev_8_21_14_0_10_40_10 TaxID=1974648 RepID=A0A2M6W383_9BACT|nr:MAG: hypothetical protein COU31_03885 [Candidatus Magasanikbacteria bacterium CG10_big_fil_rev_8_21_14_0_10_40_10]